MQSDDFPATHVRRRSRRIAPFPQHSDVLHWRASSRLTPRSCPRRIHPGPEWSRHRLVQTRRLVDLYAKRSQIQQRLTGQIAYATDQKLEPRGLSSLKLSTSAWRCKVSANPALPPQPQSFEASSRAARSLTARPSTSLGGDQLDPSALSHSLQHNPTQHRVRQIRTRTRCRRMQQVCRAGQALGDCAPRRTGSFRRCRRIESSIPRANPCSATGGMAVRFLWPPGSHRRALDERPAKNSPMTYANSRSEQAIAKPNC